MKVYVASAFANWPAVRAVQAAARSAGHTITHDWTQQVDEGVPANSDPSRAAPDVEGVNECDIFVLLSHEDACGALMEYGMALAQDKRCLVCEPERCYSMFHEMPTVEKCATPSDVGRALGVSLETQALMDALTRDEVATP